MALSLIATSVINTASIYTSGTVVIRKTENCNLNFVSKRHTHNKRTVLLTVMCSWCLSTCYQRNITDIHATTTKVWYTAYDTMIAKCLKVHF